MTPLLELEAVEAGYGSGRVLQGVSLSIGAGDAVALIGRNGVGKTTVVNTLLGVARLLAGNLRIKGLECPAPRNYTAARSGVAVVVQGRGILPNLTVRENLQLGAAPRRKGRWSLDAVFGLFPVLKQRQAGPGTALSGGEQQMLAIGRALMSNPELLILDEPSEGLAPVIVDQLALILRRLNEEGTALLLIEQHLSLVERAARTFSVLSKGRIVGGGALASTTTAELQQHIAI